MEATVNGHIYLLVKENKFREYENKYNTSVVGRLTGISLREKVTNTEITLNNDDIANACIDYFEKKLLSGNLNNNGQ